MGLLSSLPALALTIAGAATGNPFLAAAGRSAGSIFNRQPGQGLLSSLGGQLASEGANLALGKIFPNMEQEKIRRTPTSLDRTSFNLLGGINPLMKQGGGIGLSPFFFTANKGRLF
jgi:hypothetical protein